MYLGTRHFSVIAKYDALVYLVWFGLYWVLSSFFDHYILFSSVQLVLLVCTLLGVFFFFFDHYIIG